MKILSYTLSAALFCSQIVSHPGLARAAEEAGEKAPDKSGYTLFHPVPAGEMREFNPDRPSRTVGAFTVDAGHFQFETDLVALTRDSDTVAGLTTRKHQTLLNNMNLRLGILNNLELGAIVATSQRITSAVNAEPFRGKTGIGDLTLLAKFNVFGNDGGSPAFALVPYLKLPSATAGMSNHKYEGGLALPLHLELPHEFSADLMMRYARMKNSDTAAFHAEFVSSAVLSHKIVGKLEGYGEIYSQSSNEPDAGWQATLDAGLIYSVTESLKLDLGCNFGITKPADDYNPFVGLSWRI